MKHNAMLIVASLLSLLLTITHLTQDVMRQADGTNMIPIPVLIFAVWLYGTLMLSDRLWGYIIMLFGGLIGAAMIILHSRAGVISNSRGFFFVWTLFALSTTGWFTAILSARGIWQTLRSRRAARLGSAAGMSATDR
jgi:hypothetical protein